MLRTRNILFNISFALNCLLFFLLLFENRLEVPLWLQFAGRMHPLMLHFPIVIIIVTIFVEWNLSRSASDTFNADILLLLASLAAVITSLMGLFLSREEGYNSELMNLHKWGGVALSFLTLIWYVLREKTRQRKSFLYSFSFISILVLILTGHQGANLTHGENFLFEPFSKMQEEKPVSLEDAVVFTHMVKPILEDKCISCHNTKKAKGDLVMETRDLLLKGGKSGKLWDTTETDLGLMFERIHLPLDQKKHMPPKAKPQLTEQELAILECWVRSGADFSVKVIELSENDTLRLIAASIFQDAESEQYDFDAADDQVVNSLNNDYRKIEPIAAGSPALKVDFYSVSNFDPSHLKDLLKIKENIVSLNLNKMPLTDNEVLIIAQMKNLRKLNLSFTGINGSSLKKLTSLEHLKHLSLSGTNIQEKDLSTLATLQRLIKLEVWNTPVSNIEEKRLSDILPKVAVESGYSGDTVVIRLNQPIVENEEQIFTEPLRLKLKHYIKDVSIRYTLDGTEPDSIHSPQYNGNLVINKNALLKAKAYKKGWISSEVMERNFYRSSIKPDSVQLLTKAEPNYKAEGGATLINAEKGDGNFRSGKWIGFRNEPMETILFLNKPTKVSNVTISSLVDVPSYVMPAQSIEVFQQTDKGDWKLLKSLSPEQPKKEEGGSVLKGFEINFTPVVTSRLKLVVRPLPKLPSWHRGKGEKGWLFVDEVLLN